MTGSAAAHDTHGDHTISASIVALMLVAMFTALFAVMSTKVVDGPVVVIAVLLAGWSLVALWVLDRH